MKIHQIFFKNTLRNFSYLIDLGDGHLICIDPFSGREILNFIEYNQLAPIQKILITHDHCDHHDGNEMLLTHFHCPVFSHEKALFHTKTQSLHDGEVIHQFEKYSLKAIYTPGHTLSHVAFLLLKDSLPYAVFTGDCFFNAGVGNCYNGGSVEILYETINQIFEKFPEEIRIYPGHEYLKRNLEFTLKYEPDNKKAKELLISMASKNGDEEFVITDMHLEKKINMFLRLKNPNIIKNISLTEDVLPEQVFYRLRELRNKW